MIHAPVPMPTGVPGHATSNGVDRMCDVRGRERLVSIRVAHVNVNRLRTSRHGGACLRGLLRWCQWDGVMVGACACAVEGRLDHHRPTFSITAPYTRCP